jgi:TonB family protein
MASSAIAEHPVEDVIVPKTIEIIPLEKKPGPYVEDHREIKPAFKFSQVVLLEENRFRTGSRTLKALISVIALFQPSPLYPPLASQARIQGVVQIDTVLDERGHVVEMKIVSGPPLLYQAAQDALKKWKYEPTYLNDQPIAVRMIVNITFVLGQ